jgi:GTP pyrophosphokinase
MTEKMRKQVGERIRAARKLKGMSQEQLGEKLGTSFQAVSSWENGKYVPDSDHLPVLAKELDLSLDALFEEKEKHWKPGPVNSNADHMFTFVKSKAQAYGLKQTLAVMGILREAHGEQRRRSKYGFGTTYMVHPLTMACHAMALGLKDDDLIAACLAHDIVEDTSMKLADLPVGERVREAVRLVTKSEYKWSEDWEETYYAKIARNPLACLVKCLDRVHNVAGMADAFSREWMIRYVEETEKYYPDLLDEIRDIPEWNDAWWLLQYQLRTLVETFKRLL